MASVAGAGKDEQAAVVLVQICTTDPDQLTPGQRSAVATAEFIDHTSEDFADPSAPHPEGRVDWTEEYKDVARYLKARNKDVAPPATGQEDIENDLVRMKVKSTPKAAPPTTKARPRRGAAKGPPAPANTTTRGMKRKADAGDDEPSAKRTTT
ncbi:hypothetical protein LTR66_014735 [Elasticomyces elasticus]|nr:hypothetical protein LTR66_014735 [Elasticomyces elasticus]